MSYILHLNRGELCPISLHVLEIHPTIYVSQNYAIHSMTMYIL